MAAAATLIAALNLAYGEAEYRTFARLHADVLRRSVAGQVAIFPARLHALGPAQKSLSSALRRDPR